MVNKEYKMVDHQEGLVGSEIYLVCSEKEDVAEILDQKKLSQNLLKFK
jgi:hypothetical protein